ncbi:unnamed protein product [Phytomonas sp. EM1]|nr:unnamed protein product [Phytomonas sp. EM1]|eukprot:CCW63464.1 unnamed protein product [Phytomonas sp. isolate EM1]
MQPQGSDEDSLDVSITLQLLFTLSEEDWREFSIGHLSKLPTYLWSSESADQQIKIAEVLSLWPHDTTMVPLGPTTVDPREVLSILIALSGSVNPYAMHSYFVLLLNSYRQVLFGNMRRRLNTMKELPSSQKGMLHARNSLLLSMKPWVRDIIDMLEEHILPSLVVKDANPQTLETGIDCARLDSNPLFSPHIDASQGADSGKSQTTTESTAHLNYHRVDNINSLYLSIANLLQDMAHSSTLHDVCARCAVALYGTMWSSISLCRALTIGGIPISERIRDELRRINGKTPLNGFLKEAELPSNGFVVSSTERAVLQERIFQLLCKVLGVESPAEALLQLLSDEMDNPPFEHNDDHYYLNDWEKCNKPSISKTLTLWQEREQALEKLQLWDLSEPNLEEYGNQPSNEWISIMVNLGLFYLLTSLITSKKEVPLLISSSPLSFFFTISSSIAVSLKCSSAAALLGVLLFLGHCIRCIPKYCIEFPAEQRDLANPFDRAEEPCGYRIERYRIFFEILKQLVSISVMCPNAIHRTLSRSLTLEILKCLEERARIRTHMTLLVLTPFGSVARVLLDSVLKEWDFSPNSKQTEVPTALLSDLPCGIVNAIRNFLQHIESGKSEFIDPLIVSLNFFRVFMIKDRSAAGARTLIYDNSDKLILTEDCVDARRIKENNSWPWAIRHLAKTILPHCQRCLSMMGRDSGQKGSGLHKNFLPMTLSPLDEFALSSAVDSVSALLPGV